MERTLMLSEITQPICTPVSSLQVLLSQSEDDFYGSLQRIWNNVVKLEDMGIIQQENDKFMYVHYVRTTGMVANSLTLLARVK